MNDFMANVNKKRNDDLRNLDLRKLTFAEAKNIDEVYEEIQADFRFFKELIIKHVNS
jgi:ribosome biogenesis protein Nip4